MILETPYDRLHVVVPASATTLDGFRDWARSDSFPDYGKVSFIQQQVFIDMSAEKVESHNKIKTEVTRVLGNLVRDKDLGHYYQDGLWLTNDDAELSTEPDGTFAGWESLMQRRIVLVPSSDDASDGLEMRGSPDWVLEVVSTTSVAKDTKILLEAYHRAGIGEYWIVDARGEDIAFTILLHRSDGYVPATEQDGWQRSEVFDCRFHMDRHRDRLGAWQYTLHVR